MAKAIDSSLLDRAIIFATKAHANVERRGKGYPYIVHPLEAVSIVASMTSDQELLAAAALHDVIEDTEVTYEDIEKEFGKRVADLVKSESEDPVTGVSASDSWKDRKQAAIDRLAKASKEAKMVAMGDKLSNMRAIYRDFKELGDALWSRFHVSDPSLHEWHYRGLADSLSDLAEFDAYREFVWLINETFPKKAPSFAFRIEQDEVYIAGELHNEEVLAVKEKLSKGIDYLFNFAEVADIDFSGIRALLGMKLEGYSFLLREVSETVARKLEVAGITSEISLVRQPVEFDPNHMKQFGDGFTAVSYFTDDGDAMVKLYYDFVDRREIEKEKRYATAALLAGLPTPIAGDYIKVGNRTGVIFERVKNKVSFARKYADHPELVEEIAKDFAALSKHLHETPCDTAVFPEAKKLYHGFIDKLHGFNGDEMAAFHAFVDAQPDVKTCIHGDFHIGNVIEADGQRLWIDMGSFAYGSPLFDIGTFYFLTHGKFTGANIPEKLFHTSNENLYAFWKAFAKYYFDGKDEQELDALLKPFAAMTIIHFAALSGQAEYHAPLIRNWFFGGK